MKLGRDAGVRACVAFVEQRKDFRIIPSARGRLWKVASVGVTRPGFLFKGLCVVINVVSTLCLLTLKTLLSSKTSREEPPASRSASVPEFTYGSPSGNLRAERRRDQRGKRLGSEGRGE